MENQFEAMFRLQLAMWEGWFKVWKDGCVMCETLVMQQSKLMQRSPYLRLTNTIATGASLTDLYGKRARDVNVERV